MYRFLVALCLLFSIRAHSQSTYNLTGNPADRVRAKGYFSVDSQLAIPSTKTLSPYFPKRNSIAFVNDTLWMVFSDSMWHPITSGGGSGGGSVTSVTAGGYMLGGTITSAGTLTPDTSAHKLATKTDLLDYLPLTNSKFVTIEMAGNGAEWSNVDGFSVGSNRFGLNSVDTNTSNYISVSGNNGSFYVTLGDNSQDLVPIHADKDSLLLGSAGKQTTISGNTRLDAYRNTDTSKVLTTDVGGNLLWVKKGGAGSVISVSGTTGRISSTGGTTPVLDLVTVNATPATYGGASAIPVVSVDVYGRATAITTVAPTPTTLSAGTGISVSGIAPSYTVTNTAPNQTVNISAGAGISVGGVYPSYTVTNTSLVQTVNISAGTGISIGGSYPSYSVTNTSPDRTVSISAAGSATVTGTYPNFTINTPAGNAGTVTSVAAASPYGINWTGSPVTSSGTLTATVDTTKIGTRSYRQKGLDSVVAYADSKYITALTGDVSTSGPGIAASTLATVNSNVGTFGDANNIPSVTVNGKGLVTAVTTASRPVQSFRTACRVATTASLTATYNNGSAGVGATLTNSGTQAALVIDGVTLSVGDRVAYWTASVSNQFQQGVYSVTVTGSGSTNWVLTRTPEFDGSAAGPIALGAIVDIAQGASNQGILLMVNATGPFTVGTTPITFISNGANASTLAGVVPTTSGGTGLSTMNNQQIYSGGSGTAMVQDPMLTWDNSNKWLDVDATGAGDYAPSTTPSSTPPNKLVLSNGTAATVNNQKSSGVISLQGNGWKTAATAGSQTVEYRIFTQAIQGTTRPSVKCWFVPFVNGSATTPTAETWLDDKGNAQFNKVYVGQPPAAVNTNNTSMIFGSSPPPLLTGSGNTSVGQGNLQNATGTSGNVCIGDQVGASITGGGGCILIGSRSGTFVTGINNFEFSSTSTAGAASITSGTGNVAIGNYAIPSGFRTLNNQFFFSDGNANLWLYKTTGGNFIFGGGTTDDGNQIQMNGSFSATKGTFSTGINQGGGLKHVRQTTGAIGANSNALVTVTWASAFIDANYTVTASVIDATTSSAALKVTHIESVTSTAVTVRVENTSSGSLTGTINLIALHD